MAFESADSVEAERFANEFGIINVADVERRLNLHQAEHSDIVQLEKTLNGELIGMNTRIGGRQKALAQTRKEVGNSMMHEAGLPTPYTESQQLQTNMMTAMNQAQAWENAQGMERYRNAISEKLQQDAAFEAQMQPLRIKAEQQAGMEPVGTDAGLSGCWKS